LEKDNFEKLNNDQLDLILLYSHSILEKIESGKSIHYFEKKASEFIGKINKLKAKRLFGE
jgi:hypothetical protein